ncbi:hypothetical protein P0082_02620 [Candidatus Haliotispira prima]|uniref:PRAI n=1 Tax=Candidatus Haliotispira prima TaxID=3034016 RepID=A0ABY8MIX7_9SPIO|nr:hypothetical protein P0082_02620 [Candidatus Haliotispira prima]
MLVKACGLRNLQEISWAHDLGYNFWGIVVDPNSKRYVPTQDFESLWDSVPTEWRSRCVLVARKWQWLSIYARTCGEALLQCYEPFPDFVAPERCILPVTREEEWQICRAQQRAVYSLYDVSLGSGEWQGLPPWCSDKAGLFVAGGLSEDRLQELATKERGRRFFGFDLSSGLEGDDVSGRSRKDYRKMAECLKIIRNNFLDGTP